MKSSNIKYLIPNSVTLASLCMGVAAIVMASRGQLHHALWLAFLCMIFDKFDGALARKFNATSSFGVEMDSLADMVSFGVTPAVIVYTAVVRFSPHFSGDGHWIALAASLFWVITSALRLAKYNVIAQSGKFDQVFQGIPMPFAAALILAPLLVFIKYWAPGGYDPHLLDARVIPSVAAGNGQHVFFTLLVPLTVLIALGMVSPIKVPKLKVRKTSGWVRYYVVIHALFTYGLILSRMYPEILMYIGYQFLLVSVFFTWKLRTQGHDGGVPLLEAMSYQLEFRQSETSGTAEQTR